MKHWWNSLIIFIVAGMLVGCNEKQNVFKGTSDELIEAYNTFNNNDLIEVTGEIAWIEYPKDGQHLNECAVSIKTKNTTDIIRREGNVVCCKMKSRIDKNNSSNAVLIKGNFEKFIKNEDNVCVYLRNCILIQ